MEKMLKKIKSNAVISSLLCAALGLVLVLWPNLSMTIVCTAIGIVLILSGVIRLIGFLTGHDGSIYMQGNLVMGIILLVVGIWIVSSPVKVLSIIPIIVGILIVIHGVSNLQQTFALRREAYSKWWLALVLTLLTIGLGVLLIFHPFAALDTVVVLIGIFLIYDGLSSIWIISRVAKAARMAKQEAEAVDVDMREIR